MSGCAVFGGVAKAVRAYGSHLPSAFQDGIQSTTRQRHPCNASLHQARTCAGSGPTMSESRFETTRIHGRRSPGGSGSGPSATPAHL